MTRIATILLAGGAGKRMGLNTPKQFLEIGGKPLILYSFDLFLTIPEIKEIIVVCSEEYQKLFNTKEKKLTFATPGQRRQDSVYNGWKASTSAADLFCIHDGARPALNKSLVHATIQAAQKSGAATSAVPLKFTIKEADSNNRVVRTPDRSKMWEIHTPQVIKKDLLKKGFAKADKDKLTVTDDVSLAELIGANVTLVPGSYKNIKVTTQEDLPLIERYLHDFST